MSNGDMVSCPFNPAHRMLRKRLQQHMIKCRISYPEIELHPCPFNKLHLFTETELEHHIKKCPDSKLVWQYKYDEAPLVQTDVQQNLIECEENWDDADIESYDPKQAAEKANVLREPEGYFPAERKLFIKNECKRLRDIGLNNENQPSTSKTAKLTSEGSSSQIKKRRYS